MPPGTQFQKNPSNKGEVSSGTVSTVKVNGKEVAVLGSMVKTCGDPMDQETSTIMAFGAAVTIPIMVPGADKMQFERDGGFLVNTRDPVAKEGTPVEPEPRKLMNPKWDKSKAVIGETVKISVQYDGPGGYNPNIFISIWHHDADREKDLPLKKIQETVSNGQIEVEWEYNFTYDPENPITEKPKCIFTANSFRCEEVISNNIEWSANFECILEDIYGNLIKNTDCEIITADGSKKNVKTDDNAYFKVSDIVPGKLLIVPSLKDDDGNDSGLYIKHTVKEGETLTSLVNDYLKNNLFSSIKNIEIDESTTDSKIWDDEKNKEPNCICSDNNIELYEKNTNEKKIFDGEIIYFPYKGIIAFTGENNG